jgi:AcrR family transcriptional regulator
VEALLQAHEEAILAGRDDAATLQQTLERAGVSAGSFYEYFENSDGLLGALLARATRHNFAQLLAALDQRTFASLREQVEAEAAAVAHAYLRSPAMTRVLAASAYRLGLAPVVIAERDRFAVELAARAARHLPNRDRATLERQMILVCDCVMGVVLGDLFRPTPRSVDDAARDFAAIALGILEVSP